MEKFNVIVVGAGIAGLSTAIALKRKGHEVTVLERHVSCQALGGPIAISPSATRIMIEYGLGSLLSGKATKVNAKANFYRYDTGAVLGGRNLKDMDDAYGFPNWNLSRFRLQEALAGEAAQRGIRVQFGSVILSVDAIRPAVILENGKELLADLIIGADGIGSITRTSILGKKINAEAHFTAYNIDIPREMLKQDSMLAELGDQMNVWVGPAQVIVASNMPDHRDMYNMCFVTEEEAGCQGEWHVLGDLEHLKAKFRHFDSKVQKLLELADPKECYIWRLSQMPALPTWKSANGRLVLVGDSAHAMLPYAGLGASSCIEDGACLAECLDRALSVEDLPKVLDIYEQIRKRRVEWIAERGLHAATIWHLPDGEAQRQRDEIWAKEPIGIPDRNIWDGVHIDEPPVGSNVAFHPLIAPYIYAYDIIQYTNRQLDQKLGITSGDVLSRSL